MEHVPRGEAEVAAHHRGQGHAVQDEADVELRQAAAEAAGAHVQLGERTEVGEPGAGDDRPGGGGEGHAAQSDQYWPSPK